MESRAIRGMVLAAGLGTRMQPLTSVLPKPVVPVANRPLIEYCLRLLEHHGVREVAVNLYHLGAKVRELLADESRFGLRLTYSPEDPILGTGGGVVRLRSFLEGGTFFLLNADILTGVDLQAVLAFHRERGAVATMVVRPHPRDAGYTPLEVDEDGWIVGFKDARREPRGKIRSVMFSGVHVLEPRIFDFLPPDGFSCINDQGYTRMVAQGLPVAAFVDNGPWFDLGDPKRYLAANIALLSGTVRFPQLDPLQGVSGSVLLGERVRIDPTAALGPQVAVGEDCRIGSGCRLRNCVLWAGSGIAPGTHLDHAIVAGSQIVRV